MNSTPWQQTQQGAVVWVTGLSGSGKTTLCRAIRDLLQPQRPGVILLDGDIVREAFGDDLGYSLAERHVQVKRLHGVARLLAQQGYLVLVAAVYADPEILARNRERLPVYLEVYLESSLDALRSRDHKGLYAKAARGDLRDVVGVDLPWLPPPHPDLVFNTDRFEDPSKMAELVIAAIPALRDFARVR
jgi:adenylylsulfate kinase-like enzyme